MKSLPLWLTLMFCSTLFAEDLRFIPKDGGFSFDTGAFRGSPQTKGFPRSIQPLTECSTGTQLAGKNGVLTHYRLFAENQRFLPDAFNWGCTAKALPDGSVEIQWAPDEQHPFALKAVYTWAASNMLDVATTVTAQCDLKKFESFLGSYFNGFPITYGYGPSGFVQITKNEGEWICFPRDEAADKLLRDGRWEKPPHPVNFKRIAFYGEPLVMRKDPGSGLTVAVMSLRNDCFATLMPYGEDSHRSLYLSLFGRDLKHGESITAHARLVIGRFSEPEILALYHDYQNRKGR
ncbi:MAG: hypothetical protein WCJ02_10805 [bacterium]